MMKKSNIILLISILISTVGCKKDENVEDTRYPILASCAFNKTYYLDKPIHFKAKIYLFNNYKIKEDDEKITLSWINCYDSPIENGLMNNTDATELFALEMNIENQDLYYHEKDWRNCTYDVYAPLEILEENQANHFYIVFGHKSLNADIVYFCEYLFRYEIKDERIEISSYYRDSVFGYKIYDFIPD